jgi:hypothetical protein
MDLETATAKVSKAKNKQIFIDFLQAFMDKEEVHIREFLSSEKLNLRTAALCAEAYTAALSMKSMIEES